MKKNKMMRAASALLVAVLLTTCTISGTFAKYVTTASVTDTARVAKWGVEITSTGETFAASYTNDENPDLEDVGGVVIANAVVSANGTDTVVAPGTEGKLVQVELTGTPEVAVSITYDATVDLGDNWKDDTDAEYCPILFEIGGKTYGTAATGLATEVSANVDALEMAVAEAIEAYSANYQANTDLSGEELGDITWEWPYFINGNDEKDTDLGDKAADGTAATISVTVATTVTQID